MSSGPSVVTVQTAYGVTVCERCLVADRPLARMRGLLGRPELPAGDGIWIRPTNSIHMLFMRFAIDAVFLDRDDVVVRIVPSLRPWRMATCRRARSVIELRTGECESRRIKLGDRLVVAPVEEALAA